MVEKITLPAIGSEWFEDDPRVYPSKITVVEHLNAERVVIARGMFAQRRTKVSASRFGKKRGYLPWSGHANHPKARA